MPTTALGTLVERVADLLGVFWSGTTTSNSSSTTTAVSTDLKNKYRADSALHDQHWVRLPDGADNSNTTAEERRVSVYTYSTGTVTVPAAWTTDADNRVDTAKAIQVFEVEPAILRRAVQRSLRSLAPDPFHLWTPDETLLVDGLLANWDFESAIAGGAHPSWTNAGAGITVTAESTIIRHGSQSAKIVAGGGAAGQMYQAPTINVRQLTGKTVSFRCWVYATAADTARIRLSFDGGSTFENHAYHSGTDQWELQSLAVSVPTAATSVRFYLEAVAAGTGYFDMARGWVNGHHIRRMNVPSSLYTLNQVTVQDDEYEPVSSEYVPLSGYPTPGMVLRLEGKGALTVPTADASTTELGSNRAELVALHAALAVAQSMPQFADKVAMLADDYARLLGTRGVAMSASAQDRTWYDVEHGSTPVLRLRG